MPPRVAKRNADKISDSSEKTVAVKERKTAGKKSPAAVSVKETGKKTAAVRETGKAKEASGKKATIVSDAVKTKEITAKESPAVVPQTVKEKETPAKKSPTIEPEAAKATASSSSIVMQTKEEFEKSVQDMKAEAEEKRLRVLNAYLKENQGKTIARTEPPKKDKTISVIINASEVAKKKAKAPAKPRAPKSDSKAAAKAGSKEGSAQRVRTIAVRKSVPPSPSSLSSPTPASKAAATPTPLPRKLSTMDEAELLSFLQTEISLGPRTVAIFKKEKVTGMYLKGLWLHRNDDGLKDRIANIIQRLVPDDRDFALLILLLSSNANRL